MNTLNTKIVSLVNRGNAWRKYFHHIIQEAKSRSEENIRVSILAAETAQKTINFTAINDDVGSACKPDDSVSCAHSCCPKLFPVCGGTGGCPSGKCCTGGEGRFALTKSYTNVSTLFGVKRYVRPDLNFTVSNENAYFSLIRKIGKFE